MTEKNGKLALVTGGCRRLGASIAADLAAAGYALALHGHSDAEPDPMLDEALNQHESAWAGFVSDFGQEGAAETLFADVKAGFGKAPDLLVNNASLFSYDDQSSLDAVSLEKHIRINMTVPTILTTLLARESVGSSDRRAVVNIVDQRVRNPNGDQLSYTLSKQALAESIRTLATACADRLRVNGVAPGLTLPTADYDDAQMQQLATQMPLDRLSSPEDITAAVRYLATADSVTGQTLFVDGGAHLKSFDRDFVFMK